MSSPPRCASSPSGGPFLPAAVPPPAPHRAAQGPGRASGPQGRRPVPDPGPDTGAYDPFELDDEDGEDGPETVVGRPRPPRRAAFPSLLDGPATDLDLGGGRRTDGPVTRVDRGRPPGATRTRRPGSTSRGSGGVPGRRTSARPPGRAAATDRPPISMSPRSTSPSGPAPEARPSPRPVRRLRPSGPRSAPARDGPELLLRPPRRRCPGCARSRGRSSTNPPS